MTESACDLWGSVRIRSTFSSSPDEGLFGFGERFNAGLKSFEAFVQFSRTKLIKERTEEVKLFTVGVKMEVGV